MWTNAWFSFPSNMIDPIFANRSSLQFFLKAFPFLVVIHSPKKDAEHTIVRYKCEWCGNFQQDMAWNRAAAMFEKRMKLDIGEFGKHKNSPGIDILRRIDSLLSAFKPTAATRSNGTSWGQRVWGSQICKRSWAKKLTRTQQMEISVQVN